MQRLSQGCNDVMRLEDVVAKGKVEQTQLAQQCLDLVTAGDEPLHAQPT